ncbi:uncharacterized protein LOC141856791 [Brevipalpus obovatus]|uniref:uncharacterized protein LOC141856791 n=1 Tax=Brevipalpus obovatus TaxID=246614 RepID=UPI003D9DB918
MINQKKLNSLVPLFSSLNMKISLKSPSKVDHCINQEKAIGCPSASMDSVPHLYHRPEEHSPIRESNPRFRIPIGIYLQSTYVFRILAKDKDADTPCLISIVRYWILIFGT